MDGVTSAGWTAPIRKVRASEPGALDGFAWTCPTCGDTLSYSLESMTRTEAVRHAEWHNGRGK